MVIERYLDDLDDALWVGLARRDRILGEVRGHLEEAAGALQAVGEGREDAERRAVAEFGSPESIAARFGSQGATAPARAAVAVSNFLFVARSYFSVRSNRRWAGQQFAIWAPVYGCMGLIWVRVLAYPGGALAVWDLAARTLLCGVIAGACVVFALVWKGLMSMPPPGYGRRWLKLEPAARERVLWAARAGEGLSDPREARFAAELTSRVRSFRQPDWLFVLVPGAWASQAVAGLAAGFAWLVVPAILSVALPAWGFSHARRRSGALDRAEGELVLFQAVDDALEQAGHERVPPEWIDRQALHACGSPRNPACGSPRNPAAAFYLLSPRDLVGLPIGLAADHENVFLRVPGGPSGTFQHTQPDQLHELRERLALAIVESWRQHQDALCWSSPDTMLRVVLGGFGSPVFDA